MILRALLFLFALLVVSCSGSRVAVTLDQAAIRAIDHATLFPKYGGSSTDRASRQVLQLSISSETDLPKYFEDQEKQLQVRCSVDGSSDGKAYRGFATGPLPERSYATGNRAQQGQITPRNKRYRYIIYAFIDLEADSVEYKNGKPASTLNLKADHFDALTCHLIGVQKAPVPFPRSNDFSVPVSNFHALLRETLK
jgi:hypothetical protein